VQDASAGGSAVPSPPPAATRGERRVKMTMLRQRVASRLKGAQNTCARPMCLKHQTELHCCMYSKALPEVGIY
jgi:pyruvate/2-oxoglutarate dehydrogenase complex dihydrolipoamide acyltransferase (E2) component